MARGLPPLDPPMGPFARGLNQVADARLLPPNVAVEAVNVDLSGGTLKALKGPGTATNVGIGGVLSPRFTAVDAAYKWFAIPAQNFWIGAQSRQHITLDTAAVAYCTDIDAAGNVAVPRIIHQDGTVGYGSYAMGIVAPTTLSQNTNGVGGGKRAYASVFRTADGVQSNPFPTLAATAAGTGVVVNNFHGAILNLPTSTDPRVTVVEVYATDENDELGEMYYIGEAAEGTATFTDTTLPLVSTRRLNWSPGGQIDDDEVTYDFSPWPKASVLSDFMHGSNPGSATIGTGTLFGADEDGYKAIWARTGSPQHRPTENEHQLPEKTQAVRSHGFQTLYFLGSTIWSATGEADYAVAWNKTDAERGVREGCGDTVRRCPWGVLFVATGGVALYADNSAPLLTEGLLDPLWLNTLTGLHATFSEDVYWLYHDAGTILLDMRDFPNQLRITTSDKVVLGAWVNTYDFPDSAPGHFVMLNGERGNVRRWSLAQSLPGATSLAMTWRTPRETWGEPTRPKLVSELRYAGTGKATFAFYRDGEATPRLTKTVNSLAAGPGFVRLGKGFRAQDFAIRVTSPDGTAVITRLEPEGVVLYGA